MKRMSPRQLGLLGVVATTIGALGVMWKNASAIRRTQSELTAWRMRGDDAVEELRRTRQRLAGLNVRRSEIEAKAAAEKEIDAARAATARGATASASVRKPAPGEFSGRLKEARDDLAVQNSDAVRQREAWRWSYTAFFRARNFSADQVERFLDGEARGYLKAVDLETVARAQGLADGDAAVAAVRERDAREYEYEMKELLGAQGWQAWHDYRQTNWARGVAGAFGGMATLAGLPISTVQGEQLTCIIVEASRRNDRGVIDRPMFVDWERVDVLSKAVLTEAQWNLFRTAEAPGSGRGGSRFVTRLNAVLFEAAAKEAAAVSASKKTPAKSGG